MSEDCKRIDGSLRAWFRSKQAAQDFAEITPGYEGDVAHLCSVWILAPREVYMFAERRLPPDGCIVYGGCQLKRRDFIRNVAVTVAGILTAISKPRSGRTRNDASPITQGSETMMANAGNFGKLGV